MIVVDASVVAPSLIDDAPFGDRARERLRRERLTAPALIDIEVMSMFKGLARGGIVDEHRSLFAVRELVSMRLERVPHLRLLARIWGLRDNLSVYDAAYVALAEGIGARLLTADARIAKAPGIRCEVELIA